MGGLIKYLSPTPRNDTNWKCPLGRENAVENKGKLALGKADFLAVLAKHPNLVQRLCTVYFQDFICLGFPLPPECEGGRELAWLERAATHSRGRKPESQKGVQ